MMLTENIALTTIVGGIFFKDPNYDVDEKSILN